MAGKWLFGNRPHLFKGQQWCRWLFLSLLAIGIGHSVYFLGKHFTFDRRNFRDPGPLVVKYIKDVIQQNAKAKTDVVVSDVNGTFTNYGVLLGAKGLLGRQELNFNAFHTEHPTRLLLILKPNHLTYYSSWLQKEGVRQVAEIGPYKLYAYYIEPDL